MPSRYKKSTKPRSSPSGRKLPPTGTDADLNLASMSAMFADEDKAREFIEAKRWPNGAVCPHCQCTEVYKLTAHKLDSKRPMRKGVYKCKECRKQFTVRIGTIFEESKLPLRKWLMAMHLISSGKKGVSAHQIAREVDCTLTTAWFLMHRIRECMSAEPLAGMLEGVVECDETWVGGKPRPGANPGKEMRGRSNTAKSPVMVLVERDGNAVCRPIANITANELRTHLVDVVNPLAQIVTDDCSSYDKATDGFLGGHETVNHSSGVYSRYLPGGMNVNTNTAESFFAILKRGHYGIYHRLSKKHLHRYCHEFRFRWNARKTTDGQRMVKALAGAEGKRLKYKTAS